MSMQDYELKRALDTYFREQRELQEKIVKQLASIEKQNRALVAIFGAAVQHVGGKQ